MNCVLGQLSLHRNNPTSFNRGVPLAEHLNSGTKSMKILRS